jgi:hypothetical protein
MDKGIQMAAVASSYGPGRIQGQGSELSDLWREMQGKHPPADLEAFWLRAPQRGWSQTNASKVVNVYDVDLLVHVAGFLESKKRGGRSTRPKRSNGYCFTGRARGSPDGLGLWGILQIFLYLFLQLGVLGRIVL